MQSSWASTKSSRRLSKGGFNHLKKKQIVPLRTLREFRVFRNESTDFHVGQKITVDQFTAGDMVDVTGTSKGRGFQGGMRRHNFGGGPITHGQSDRQRSPAPSAPARRRAGWKRVRAWSATWARLG